MDVYVAPMLSAPPRVDKAPAEARRSEPSAAGARRLHPGHERVDYRRHSRPHLIHGSFPVEKRLGTVSIMVERHVSPVEEVNELLSEFGDEIIGGSVFRTPSAA